MKSIWIPARVISMKRESWNVYLLLNDQRIFLNFLVRVVYKVKIFKIFVIFCFYIVARIAWEWKKLEEKDSRV